MSQTDSHNTKRAPNIINLKSRRSKPSPLSSWVISDLPFVSSNSRWDVAPTGDYFKDNQTGREYAFAFMEFEHRKPGELQGSGIPEISIIVDMVKAGQDNGIVRGFFFTLVECSTAAWCPDRLAAMRQFYDGRERHYAECRAREKREEFDRRSAAGKKAAETRRKLNRARGV